MGASWKGSSFSWRGFWEDGLEQRVKKREAGADDQLAEVWGDIVSRGHLAKAIILCSGVSLLAYYSTFFTFAPLASNPMVGRAIAMLGGLAGSLVGGAACAMLFRPKRHIADACASNEAWKQAALAQIMSDGCAVGSLDELPSVVVQEIREAGLYEVFQEYEARQHVIRQGVTV